MANCKVRYVVSCPIKNDNQYLIEFVEHYLRLGFDKIVFYDNNDDDDIHPEDVLTRYVKLGKVTVVDYRNQVFDDALHRRHCFLTCDFEWILFVDDDEFLELVQVHSISALIHRYGPQVTKIALNNLHFGDNELLYFENGSVQERFRDPLPLTSGTVSYLFNSAVKSLLKKVPLDNLNNLNAHTLLNSFSYYSANGAEIFLDNYWRMKAEDISFEVAYIKHYCTRSLEEFVSCKVKRALSNNARHKERFGLQSYYYQYNLRTQVKDDLFGVFMENI